MILKYKDHDDQWGWIGGVTELQQLGKFKPTNAIADEYGADIEYIGESNRSTPVVMFAVTDGKPRIIALNCTQAYLCNSSTGSTIDVVYQEGN